MLKRFIQSSQGSVVVILCFAAIPLMMILGLAVDTAMAYNQQRKLQNAVESAARAGGYTAGDDATLTSVAQNVFSTQTNGMTGVTGPIIVIDDAANTITVSASVLVNTMFIRVGGATDGTYSATKTQRISSGDLMEIGLMVESSQYAIKSSWLKNASNALRAFVDTLPNQALMSIVPTTTGVYFDSTTTVPGNFFNHLSMTANDESVDPAFFPLSPNYTWNFGIFSLVGNIFYSNTFANKTSHYPLPGVCPSGTMNACSTLYPGMCSGKRSCVSNYSYYAYPMVAMLPLTRNKTTLKGYLTTLASTSSAADGLFTSLLSWTWRTIDPAWKDFFQTNVDPSGTTRSSGIFPRAYGSRQKSIIIVVEGASFWDEVQSNPIMQYYTRKCGDSSSTWLAACKPGYPCFDRMKYVTTAYGILPLVSNVNTNSDGTCQNYDYVTADQGLGLNRSTTSYLDMPDNGNAYETLISNEVNAKMNRICSNIKNAGVDIYIVHKASSINLSGTACANASANVFQVSNTQAAIAGALNSIYSKIMAKQAAF